MKTNSATPTAPKKSPRETRSSLLIEIMVLRNALAQPGLNPSAATLFRRQMTDAQFALERSLIRSMGLDHLDSVETAYGLRQRKPRGARKATPAPATPVAA
jgi:hypothetical protein